MHELPRNQPAVRQKWIKFIQFKRADFLAAPHHVHLCSEHFSECDFANPMEYRMGFASKLTRCSSTLSKSSLTGSNWYGCILAGSLWQSISFVFGARVGHFAATPQSDVAGIWSRDLGVMATLLVRQKMPLFHTFRTLRSLFGLHHHSQRALTEICQKSPLTLDLSFKSWYSLRSLKSTAVFVEHFLSVSCMSSFYGLTHSFWSLKKVMKSWNDTIK